MRFSKHETEINTEKLIITMKLFRNSYLIGKYNLTPVINHERNIKYIEIRRIAAYTFKKVFRGNTGSFIDWIGKIESPLVSVLL